MLSIRHDDRGLQLKRKESEVRDNRLESEIKRFEMMDEICNKGNEKAYEVILEEPEEFKQLVLSLK